jgi:hypothetical protein
MLGGYVYIMASAPNGILYVGVTSDLVRRIHEHRNGLIAGFTKKIFGQTSCLLRTSRNDSGGDPARTQYQALVAQVESQINLGRPSGMERSVRLDRPKNVDGRGQARP